MKTTAAALLALLLSPHAAVADGTREAEAAVERERAMAAARDKAAEEAHRREASGVQAANKANMASDYRRSLGDAARGKSDDEVIRLYREREIAAGRTP